MLKISECVENDSIYYAHKRPNKNETLEEHCQLTLDYFMKISTQNGLSECIDGMIRKLIKPEIAEIEVKAVDAYVKNLFLEAIYYHDIGKLNRDFQVEKMKNPHFDLISEGMSEHSIISSLLYIDIQFASLKGQGFKQKSVKFLKQMIVNFAYMISRHHGYLKDLNHFADRLAGVLEGLKDHPNRIEGYCFKERLFEYESDRLETLISNYTNHTMTDSRDLTLLILNKVLYSGIVACDFYATGDFMNQSVIDDFGYIEDAETFTNTYFNDPLIQSIQMFDFNQHPISINHLRTEIFNEAADTFVKHIDKSIFYLEAPTGSGKTLTSINIAVQALLKEPSINRIFYVFPFNTLIDQTQSVLSKLFDASSVAVVNAISPIKEKASEESEIGDYNKSYLDRIFLHYPITLTSHVKFFSNLMGVGRESHLPLIHMANSLVIIDEIQSYKNMIWSELILLMEHYAKCLNIRFIIMSATLPQLNILSGSNVAVNLLQDGSRYYQSPYFKDRVAVDCTMLDCGVITLEALKTHLFENVILKQKNRILIEFIDKESARTFFKSLKVDDRFTDYAVEELTGDDHILFREEMISKLKAQDALKQFIWQKVIVVATQVIEAGVDIDMDIGYKDISLIDSEEQFIGRINRSCMRLGCKVFFFDYTQAKTIYRDDVRIDFNLRNLKYRQLFIDKQFGLYFDDVLKRLATEKLKANKNALALFQSYVQEQDYLKFYKHMKLIDQVTFTIFIPRNLNAKGVIIEGAVVWQQYKDLLLNMDKPYTQKQIELSKLNRVISYFTYSVHAEPLKYDDLIGEMYYLSEGEEMYLEDEKFNRKYYKEINGGASKSYEDMIL
ncbi:CRISPR-associated helicase/endonuclease Cas3 [Fusibacter sp. 3D3]|uniref:CRISPR-associated helicase/endonuclease Cas3 n=1 Tax=Fusibacter sp. 3D3 TaxID=1048380 RepID=UPI000853BC52|nr:CRISPR-associated helicase/endonuclease Cas3 [Fusibacter sp. 3D3]GAU77702.1 CRISPR-associated helicase Cas3 [Fusibacter sp. 3D3]